MYENSKLLRNQVLKSYVFNKFHETMSNNETPYLINIKVTWKSALIKETIIGWNLKQKYI